MIFPKLSRAAVRGRVFDAALLLVILAILFCIFSHSANAAPPSQPQAWDTNYISWVDGGCTPPSLLPCISGFELQHSAAIIGPFTPVSSLANTVTDFTINGVVAGPHCYRVVAIAFVAGANANSLAVCKTNVKPPVPNPPLLTVDKVASRLDIGYHNQFKLVTIGTVPLNILCTTSTAMDRNVIADRMKATLIGTVRPNQILAKCARSG